MSGKIVRLNDIVDNEATYVKQQSRAYKFWYYGIDAPASVGRELIGLIKKAPAYLKKFGALIKEAARTGAQNSDDVQKVMDAQGGLGTSGQWFTDETDPNGSYVRVEHFLPNVDRLRNKGWLCKQFRQQQAAFEEANLAAAQDHSPKLATGQLKPY